MENISHVRQMFSHTLIYGLGIALNKSVNFILLPIYTKYFPPEQIGMFTLVQSISLFLGVIYTFGMETSFMKYFIDARTDELKTEIYSSSLIFLFLSSLFLSFILYISSENLAIFFKFENLLESNFLIQILSILMFVDTLYRFPLLLFRAELKTKTYAYINLFTFFVNIVCNIIFIIILKKGVEAIFYCYIISTLLTFFIGLVLTRKYLILKISIESIKKLFMYGNKFIYIGLFLILIDLSDRFFLKYFFDESVVGIYWANYRLATVMSLVIASFKFSWTPYFLNLSSNSDNKKIISNIFTYFIFAGLFLFLIFSIFMNQIVKISLFGFNLLDVNYWSGLSIVPIVLISYFFSGLFSTLNAAPFFTDNTASILVITFFGFVINTLLNFLLIPSMNITGAALSTSITYFIMFIIIYIYSQKIYKIVYDWGRILKLCLFCMIIFSIGYFVVNNANMSTFMIIVVNLILISLYLLAGDFLKIIELKKLYNRISG